MTVLREIVEPVSRAWLQAQFDDDTRYDRQEPCLLTVATGFHGKEFSQRVLRGGARQWDIIKADSQYDGHGTRRWMESCKIEFALLLLP
jgi:hypothetical protein